MHVLRCTLFTTPTDYMTTVVRESDVQSFGEVLGGRPAEAFLAHHVFEIEDGSIEFATGHAVAQAVKRAPDEMNMAISFFWNADHLGRLRQGGHMVNPAPAPYGPEQCREVLLQLHGHPNYNRHTIIQNANDGTLVTLFPNGKVKTG